MLSVLLPSLYQAMREKLQKRNQERFTARATVKRYGGKLTNIPKLDIYSWQETILLVDVKDAKTDELLTDHVWLKVGKRLQTLNAKTGDLIQFDGRIDVYRKKGGHDYHFENPTRLIIVESHPELFPEQEAREVGMGIEYAKKLKEEYEKERG